MNYERKGKISQRVPAWHRKLVFDDLKKSQTIANPHVGDSAPFWHLQTPQEGLIKTKGAMKQKNYKFISNPESDTTVSSTPGQVPLPSDSGECWHRATNYWRQGKY